VGDNHAEQSLAEYALGGTVTYWYRGRFDGSAPGSANMHRSSPPGKVWRPEESLSRGTEGSLARRDGYSGGRPNTLSEQNVTPHTICKTRGGSNI
jgi:hypothetical protein